MTALRNLPRLVDLLCQPCQDTILRDGWTIDTSRYYNGKCRFTNLFKCKACRRKMATPLERYREFATLHMLRTFNANGSVALHESAHARTAQALGVDVFMVEMTRRGRMRGDLPEGGTEHAPTDDLLHHLTIGLAGQEAEIRSLIEAGKDSRANLLDIRFGAQDDTLYAIDAIRQAAGADDLLTRARVQANALLDEHWPSVKSLARLLLRRGRLTFDDTGKIIDNEPLDTRVAA